MRIQVNFDEVRASGTVLDQKAASYEETVNRIYSRLNEIGAVWQGEDSQAFLSQLESLRPSLMQLKSVMDSYAQLLRQSADAYAALQSSRAANARML